MIGIYKITNPKGHIYVGQTKDSIKREKSYRRKQCYRQTKIYRSIIKYGWDNHTFEVIHVCDAADLDEMEVFYIKNLNSLDRGTGMNMKEGGKTGKLTPDGVAKMAMSLKKRFIDDPSLYIKMSEMGKASALKTKGIVRPKSHIENIIKGKIKNGTLKMKQESIDKMTATIRKRFAEDPSFKERMIRNNKLSKGNIKSVRCTVTGKTWPSCKDMCQEMGLDVKYTRKQLSGSRTNFTTYEYIK